MATTKGQPQRRNARAPSQSFSDRVRAALNERGLLDGVIAALAGAHVTFEDAFGRNDKGAMGRTRAVVYGRSCAVAWLYRDSGARLSYPEIERITGMDHTTARACVLRAEAK